MPDEKPNEELALGPGGVGTPTPEPGPTPTPQDAPPAPAELKPLGELLGKPGEAPPAELVPPAEVKSGEVVPPVEPKPRSDPSERINKLTAEKWEARRAKDAAEARAKLAEDTLAELARRDPMLVGGEVPPAGTPPAQPPVQQFTQADMHREAARLAAVSDFNKSVDAAVIAGRKEHQDFDSSVAGLKAITGPIIPQEFVAAALETGEAAEVIYQLGKDPAEADRILSLPPIPMAVALASYAGAIKAARGDITKPVVSKAPPPIAPRVGGRASAETNLETVSMADFIKSRNASEAASRAERGRR